MDDALHVPRARRAIARRSFARMHAVDHTPSLRRRMMSASTVQNWPDSKDPSMVESTVLR